MREKIKILFDRVKRMTEESERYAKESKLAANEASHGMATSYSVSGDVEHAKNTALLSLQKLQQMKKLLSEVEKELEQKPPKQSVRFVS